MSRYLPARPAVEEVVGPQEFQLIDIIEQEQAFQLFGVTRAGNSIQVVVRDYQHSFYIGQDYHMEQKDVTARIASEMKAPFTIEEVKDVRTIYRLNRQPACFFKLSTGSVSGMRQLRDAAKGFSHFNSDIDGRTRFLVDCGAVGCGWMRVKEWRQCSGSECQISLEAPFSALEGFEETLNAPIRVMSFDIECISREGFPAADRLEDKIITIGICTQTEPSGTQCHVALQLGSTAPLHTGHCASFNTEEELVREFFQCVRKYDPDVLSGYNIDNFDFPYIFLRAKTLKLGDVRISRLAGWNCQAVAKIFQSNQLGTRESFEIQIPGRVSIDVLPQIQLAYKLRSYTLNNVSSEFLKEQKDDVHYSTILPLFEKDSFGRRTIAQYCLKDALLPIKLINKLMIIFQMFELAKVTGVPLVVLTKQGQQVRMISLLARYAKQHNVLIPHRANKGTSRTMSGEDSDDAEELEGATVLEPKKGFYDKNNPIATLDFSSLYPSIIIAHNLCYSTLIDRNQLDLAQFNNDFNTRYETIDELMASDMVTKTPMDFYFLKQEKVDGLLPQILMQVLAARKKAKKDMNAAQDPLAKKVLNGRQLALKVTANSLYGFTGALQTGKLPSAEISSSVTGFGRQMIEQTKNTVESFYVAGAVVELDDGGPALRLTKNAEVVYGDTDSVMVRFGVTFQESFRLAVHAAALVTKKFKKPISLEFEKVYCPYLLISKKRYAGLYWTQPNTWDKIDVKGLELVRRDNCQLVAIVMKAALEKLLVEGDTNEAISFIKGVVHDLVTERIDTQLLVISKAYSQSMDSYKNKSQPHLTVVDKLKARGHTVKIGDRIPYVVVRSSEKELYKRAEDPQFALQKGLPIDTDYYLHQQLEKPLARLFKDIIGKGSEEEAARQLFSGQHTLYSAPKVTKGSSPFSKMVVAGCLSCGARLEQSQSSQPSGKLCPTCLNQKAPMLAKYSQLVREAQLAQQRLSQIQYECCLCQDMEDAFVQCSNKDCEVYYARYKQILELERCQDKLHEWKQATWFADQ